MIHARPDLTNSEALVGALVDAPSLTRTLYPRGGFEGLEPNVLQVLIALYAAPDQTVGELVERLVLGQGTVSTALGVLEKRKLVTAQADPEDRRRQRQRITRSGTALAKRFLREVRQRLQ